MKCPECGSVRITKDGFQQAWVARKKIKIQRYRCHDCGRSFAEKRKKKNGS